MKKPLGRVLLAALTICCVSCKKDSEKIIKIEVVEYKTNTPIPAATLDFYEMGDFHQLCLCWDARIFLTKQTDANGACSFSETDFNQAVDGTVLSKENYWTLKIESAIQTRYEMELVCALKLHLIKINSYPEKAYMTLLCNDERFVNGTVPNGAGAFFLPSDTSFTCNAFGNQSNTVSWKVYDPVGASVLDSGFQKIDVAKSGITEAEIKY
ncbi:MAG TPA: hypothetical protein VNV85_04080 [Puia sp.]|jgi:hypothetical protein|nr:hypothetical protein [Puia sp.]